MAARFVVRMYEPDLRHQAVGGDRRIGRLGHGYAITDLESARQRLVADDDMLLDAEITKPFDEFYEMFAGPVYSRFQVDVTDLHVSPTLPVSRFIP
jgi:hypothetical protein